MRAHLNDTTIFFDVDGAGVDGQRERPTIVALHGGPGLDHGCLRAGLRYLRELAQVVYVDLRGQGRSGRPPLETCTIEQSADDVAALCRLLGIAKPVVLGHSAGGFVAMHLAVRHPSLAGGLLLCNTSPTLAPLPDEGEPHPTLAARAPADVNEIAGRFFGGDTSDAMLAAYMEKVSPYYAGPSHMDVPPRMFAASTMSLDVMRYFFANLASSYDVRPMLASIEVPTVVVVGRYDWVCPPVAGRTIARGIPGATLVEIETAGHFTYAEEPARFRSTVASFLETLTRP
jgi:proline iminopeptidase